MARLTAWSTERAAISTSSCLSTPVQARSSACSPAAATRSARLTSISRTRSTSNGVTAIMASNTMLERMLDARLVQSVQRPERRRGEGMSSPCSPAATVWGER
jgi:Tfp pilus assembly protein PilV